MGGFTPVPIDPLPTPQAQPVEAKPAQADPGGFKGYPPEAGWTGKGGQSLNVVSNFLSGWMAGKHMQEQKKLDTALKNVGNYETDYKNSMTIYQNVLNNPDSTPDQKEKARQDVLTNWHELHQVQKQYLMPDEKDQKGKKKSVASKLKSNVKNAFSAQEPHLFAAGAIDMADKMDPTQGLRPDPKDQEAQFRFAEEKKEAAKKDEYSSLLKKVDRTPDEQKKLEGLEDEMFGPGAADKGKVATIQRQEMEQNQKDTDAARAKYKAGQQLNERERTLLERAGELPAVDVKTPFEAYAKEVGPDKKFKTYAEAADAYYAKEVQVQKAARNPSMWEEMTQAGRDVLKEQYAKDDADPNKPHTYRITIGGKTEERQLTDEQVKAAQAQDKNLKATKVPRVPTKGDVFGWVAERMKPSPEEQADAKNKYPKPQNPAQMAQAMSPVFATVLQDNPDWDRFVAKRPGPGGGITMALNPFKESDVKWYELTSTQKKNYEDFLKAVQNEMIRRGYGDMIPKVLPMNDPVSMEMTPPPGQ